MEPQSNKKKYELKIRPKKVLDALVWLKVGKNQNGLKQFLCLHQKKQKTKLFLYFVPEEKSILRQYKGILTHYIRFVYSLRYAILSTLATQP